VGASARGAALAVVTSTVAALPAFLPGAVALRLRAEFGWSASELGLALTGFFLAAALASVPAGRLVDRLGARWGMTLGISATGASLLAIASSTGYATFTGALGLGGLGAAFVQPAANRFLLDTVTPGALGRAFAVKQSAIPAATLLAGLAVPTLALALGWRAPMIAGGALAGAVALLLWQVRRVEVTLPEEARRAGATAAAPVAPGAGGDGLSAAGTAQGMPAPALALLALTGAIGGGCATALGTFLVETSVAAGIAEGTAGLLLAAASLSGVAARLALGLLADRRPALDRLRLIGLLLITGAAGYGLLASGDPRFIALGSVVAYALAWGWPGLFHLVVVTGNRASPAAATGVVQLGIALGAGFGPLGFGALTDALGHRSAWVAVASLSVAGGAAALAARRLTS